jgi:glycosyltransferase involved in cell wall biosynthesis
MPESIAPCMERFSFEPGDPGAIAAALEALLATEAATMAALGAEARRWVVERYDIRVTNRQILDAVRVRFPALAQRKSA